MPETADRFDAESVRRCWDAAADAYVKGQASGRDDYRYDFFGPERVAHCGDVAGLRPLDLGCGNGYFSREMATRGAAVTGVDLSPRMIDHARRIEAENPLGITYHVSDAAHLDSIVSTDSYDIATSCIRGAPPGTSLPACCFSGWVKRSPTGSISSTRPGLSVRSGSGMRTPSIRLRSCRSSRTSMTPIACVSIRATGSCRGRTTRRRSILIRSFR
ncbi:MAG: hypothetical protein CMJ18_12950 [Phycisphaeraceae bacterium]|nr:hypothetical protein [Phycisphaeraceae bacterium]